MARRSPLSRQLGRRIVQLRTELGMTQEQLAWAAELGSKGYLSRIESGQRLPSLELVERLARELSVEPRDLLTFPETGPAAAAIEELRKHGAPGAERVLAALTRFSSHTSAAPSGALRAAEAPRARRAKR